MARDQVSVRVSEQEFLFCEACRIKARLDHEACPRCRGPLVRRNASDVAAESCRALEQHRIRHEVRAPMIAAGVALVFAAIGTPYALLRSPATPTVEPLVLGRAAPSLAATAPTGVLPDDGVDLRVADAEAESRAAFDRGDLEAALAGYLAVLEERPDDLNALNNAGQVLIRLGRAAEAVPLLERAVSISPVVWLGQFNLAQALGETGAWGRAAGHYEAAAELMPDHYPTLFNLGLALQRAGRDDGAVQPLARAAAIDPAQADPWLLLGTSYQRLDRRSEASDAYRRYLELAPGSPEREKVEHRIALLAAAPPPAQAVTPAVADTGPTDR